MEKVGCELEFEEALGFGLEQEIGRGAGSALSRMRRKQQAKQGSEGESWPTRQLAALHW